MKSLYRPSCMSAVVLMVALVFGATSFPADSFAAKAARASKKASAGKSKTTKQPAEPKNWSVSLGSSLYTELYKQDSVARSVTSGLSVGAGLKTEYFHLSVGTGLLKELSDERRTYISDGRVGVRFTPLQLSEIHSGTTSLGLTIPLNKRTANIDKLYTSVSGAGILISNWSKAGIKNLSSTFSVRVYKNFHEAETSELGNPLKSVGASTTLGVSYSPLSWLGLYVDASFAKSWTYNDKQSDNYGFTQSASFSLWRTLSLTIGHQIGGNVIAADGQSVDIAFIDDRRSQIFASVGYRF